TRHYDLHIDLTIDLKFARQSLPNKIYYTKLAKHLSFDKETRNMQDKGNIIVLGGDGFCGWPTSLRLSNDGYNVTIVDNLSRRKIDVELGCRSLTPIETTENRIA